jgi:hypothetical protein
LASQHIRRPENDEFAMVVTHNGRIFAIISSNFGENSIRSPIQEIAAVAP